MDEKMANAAIRAIRNPRQLPVSEGCNPQEPQVDDSIGQEFGGSGWSAAYTL
jgi:hypothetical protein